LVETLTAKKRNIEDIFSNINKPFLAIVKIRLIVPKKEYRLN